MAEMFPGNYWHNLDDGRVQCDLCPRYCKLHEGQHGLCFVRRNVQDHMVLSSYGRSSGFIVDPIEKKPLNHFYPGSSVFSFGTAGCNLACKFCQNWDISKSREMDALMSLAQPENIAEKAKQLQCTSVAFTYNDPVVFHEYAVDTAIACREFGVKSVAVSAGYVCAEPRAEFYSHMDAANIDLKAFSERFYRKIAGGQLQPVLETLQYLVHETDVWLEVTTLIIPGENDTDRELDTMTQWFVEHLGTHVPLHFSAFHPDWKMQDKPRTSEDALIRARTIALENGLHHVYVGNVYNKTASSTYCQQCGAVLIVRDWYRLYDWNLDEQGDCRFCGQRCSGKFAKAPGKWGAKRLPVRM